MPEDENNRDDLTGEALEGAFRLADKIIDGIQDAEARDRAKRKLDQTKIKVLDPGRAAWRNLAQFAREISDEDYEEVLEDLEDADDAATEAVEEASAGVDAIGQGDEEAAKEHFKEAQRLAKEAAKKYKDARRKKRRAVRRALRQGGGAGSKNKEGGKASDKRTADRSLEKLEGVDARVAINLREAGVSDLAALADPVVINRIGKVPGISKERMRIFHEQAKLNEVEPRLTANELEVAVVGFDLRVPLDSTRLLELSDASNRSIEQKLEKVKVPQTFGTSDVRNMFAMLLEYAG